MKHTIGKQPTTRQQKFLTSTKWFIVVLLLGITQSSMAETISGNIEFTRRPPIVGVLYSIMTNSQAVNGIIDQNDKAFIPQITATTPQSTLVLKNSDDLEHNVFANDLTLNTQFDIGLIQPEQNTSLKVDWSPNSLIRLGCKIHPKMKAYVANIPSHEFKTLEFKRTQNLYEFSFEVSSQKVIEIVVMMPKYETLTISLMAGNEKTETLRRRGKDYGTITLSRP